VTTPDLRYEVLAAAVSVLLVVFASSCGKSGSEQSLSAAGERGQEIARGKGCAACHGLDGQGGVGPAWVGLAGAEVELLEGTFATADDAYLVRSIQDPSADIRAGFNVQMPANRLGESEIGDVIAYIKDLDAENASG
jgi:cytochrome c oxidase subunit 2